MSKCTRIQQAINETQQLLSKALSYSADLQKPAQIEYYKSHIAFLTGESSIPAKADHRNWNAMRCVIEAKNKIAI